MEKPIMDYTGMRIGELTVLRKLASEGSSRYLCECSCGNQCVKTVAQLSRAHYYSKGANCGCKTRRMPEMLIGQPRKKGVSFK